MIELRDDNPIFSFPDVHPQAKLRISFQRTLRIPDDDSDYPPAAGPRRISPASRRRLRGRRPQA